MSKMWTSDATHSRRRDRLLLAIVLAATLLAYLPTLTFPFAADDVSQILRNPRVHSVQYVPEYFKTHVWGHLAMAEGEHGAAYYRPLFLLWELATWLLFGINTLGWHLSALACHLLATALAFLLLRRLTGDSFAAFAGALLFGVHPIHIEGVAWISGATEPLATAPFIGAMLCWLRAYESERPVAWRCGAVALYAVALLAKETTIVLPGVLLAYELLLRRDRTRLAARLVPYVVVMLVYLGVRQITLAGTAHTEIPLGMLLLTWPSVLWYYLSHALVPIRLSLLNDLSLQPAYSWSEVGFPALCLAVSAAVIVWLVRGKRLAWFAVAWAALLILPPLYLRAFSPVEIAHERYLYLPSLGLCLLFALGLRLLPARAALLGATALALVFFGLTVVESRPWADEVTLFTRAIEVAPHSWHARRQLAFALERTKRCDDAIPQLAAIIDATPQDYVATFAMGVCYFRNGEFSDAERLMRRAIQLHPGYQQPYLLLATILVGLGRVDEAEEQWKLARGVQIGGQAEPSFHLVRAEILKARGDMPGAIAEYRKELEIQPGNEQIIASLTRAEDTAAAQR